MNGDTHPTFWRRPLPQRQAFVILAIATALAFGVIWATTPRVRDKRFRVAVKLSINDSNGTNQPRRDILPEMTLSVQNQGKRSLSIYTLGSELPDRIIVTKDGKSFTLWHKCMRPVGMYTVPPYKPKTLAPGQDYTYVIDPAKDFVTDSHDFTNRYWIFLTNDWSGYTVTAHVPVDDAYVFSNPVTIGVDSAMHR